MKVTKINNIFLDPHDESFLTHDIPGPQVTEGFLSTGVFTIPELYDLTRVPILSGSATMIPLDTSYYAYRDQQPEIYQPSKKQKRLPQEIPELEMNPEAAAIAAAMGSDPQFFRNGPTSVYPSGTPYLPPPSAIMHSKMDSSSQQQEQYNTSNQRSVILSNVFFEHNNPYTGAQSPQYQAGQHYFPSQVTTGEIPPHMLPHQMHHSELNVNDAEAMSRKMKMEPFTGHEEQHKAMFPVNFEGTGNGGFFPSAPMARQVSPSDSGDGSNVIVSSLSNSAKEELSPPGQLESSLQQPTNYVLTNTATSPSNKQLTSLSRVSPIHQQMHYTDSNQTHWSTSAEFYPSNVLTDSMPLSQEDSVVQHTSSVKCDIQESDGKSIS